MVIFSIPLLLSRIIVTRHILDSNVTPDKLASGAGSSWAWKTWTPTFSGNGSMTVTGTPSVLVARYLQIGKTIFFYLDVQGKTLSGTANTEVYFTAPVNRTSTDINAPVGFGNINNAQAETAQVNWSGTSTSLIAMSRPTKTSFVSGGFNGMISGFYEIA